MKRTGFFNVYVLTLKQEKGNKNIKHKYRIKDYKCYRHVNRELACYLINKQDCCMIGMTEKRKPTTPLNGYTIYGYNVYDPKNITFCITANIFSHNRNDDLIFPDLDLVSYRPSPSFQYHVNDIIKCLEDAMHNNEIHDYSCQCSFEWGPKNLIPKGFVWVKEGNIQDGDFVWVSENANHSDYWSKVTIDKRFHAEVGQPIEKRGIIFIDEDESETLFEYYHPFIIRKK